MKRKDVGIMSESCLPKDKVLSQLSMAMKAGKLVSGEFMVEKAIKSKEAFLVIVAEDASDNTKKHFNDMCAYRDIPIRFIGSKIALGKSIGKDLRANVALLDEGFAKGVLKKIDA